MLATVTIVWWPKLHRKVLTIAWTCPQCTASVKNDKFLFSQKDIGKLPLVRETDEEKAIVFASLLVNAKSSKRYLLVSMDHFSS